MPLVRSSLDLMVVIDILKSKGYGVNRNRLYELQLTKALPETYSNGTPKRIMMKGLSKTEVATVLQKAETVDEAAMLFERASLGETTCVVEEVNAPAASNGLTAEVLATIIDNRVANGISMRLEGVMAEIHRMKSEVQDVLDKAKAVVVASQPKKRGRPPKVKPAEQTPQPPAA